MKSHEVIIAKCTKEHIVLFPSDQQGNWLNFDANKCSVKGCDGNIHFKKTIDNDKDLLDGLIEILNN